jgi:3-deoxy-manno-octulosonate cytidylyltransferase (CMP-KDO synthetase)
MRKRKVAAVIPARMGASRFPGKPMVEILGLPMVEHVRRRVGLCRNIDEVDVATCDTEIFDAVVERGGKAVMTKDTHQRCTDRVEEASHTVKADIIVIVQGDEPLLDPGVLEKLVKPMLDDPAIECANLLSVISAEEDLLNIDIVKTVIDKNNNVIYYSRAPIPYLRCGKTRPMYRQTGLSAFRNRFLQLYSRLPQTPLEVAESVDFLRIIENRFPVLGVIYKNETVGVDRPEDIARVEAILLNDRKQRALYKRISKI